MSVLQDLLRRWGFVKLRSYGLDLTVEGRIVSTRPVLNDGTGVRIVGWRDGDVSIWKLSDWRETSSKATAQLAVPPVPVPRRAASPVLQPRAASPVLQPRAASPVLPPRAASPVLQPRAASPVESVASPLPETAPPVAMPTFPAAALTALVAPTSPPAPSAAVMPADVAAEPTVDEDDWEWTIALARARVAVEEAEAARPPSPAVRIDARPREALRPVERPTPRAASIKDPAASAEWPKTDLSGSIDYDDYSRVPTRPAMAIPRAEPPAVTIPRTTTPSTVIPVPALPTMATSACTRLEPVVRSAQPSSAAASAARFAKGTGPVDPPPTTRPQAVLIEDTVPDLSVGDRTRPGVAVRALEPEPPPVSDRTRPGIALPPAARAVQLPSIKRRMLPR